MLQGHGSFSVFLHNFVLAKLATSSIRVNQRFIIVKVSISAEMAIIPYIHKQILLKDKYRTPQRDFYCLLTTLATCLISIEYGVRCSPGTINEKNI